MSGCACHPLGNYRAAVRGPLADRLARQVRTGELTLEAAEQEYARLILPACKRQPAERCGNGRRHQ